MNTDETRPSSRLYSDGKPESMPESKLRSRYIYYRLYLADGPLESVNPIYSNDRFISRILSKSVAPPHTAVSLKKYLARIEGFETEKSTLYLSLSEKTHIEDTTRLSLRGKSGPGLSELDPISIVVDLQPPEKRPPTASKTPLEQFDEAVARYVYYRLYEENGEVVSKTSFDETDSSLGRINRLSIPPPHTVASFKAHLIKAEGVPGHSFQLFEDEGGETTMNDGDSITFPADTYPGVSEDEPIAAVYATDKKTPSPSKAPVLQPQSPGFSKVIEGVSENLSGKFDPLWHSTTVGEIFHTDGIRRTEPYRPSYSSDTETTLGCYMAINCSGKKALVYARAIRFC